MGNLFAINEFKRGEVYYLFSEAIRGKRTSAEVKAFDGLAVICEKKDGETFSFKKDENICYLISEEDAERIIGETSPH